MNRRLQGFAAVCFGSALGLAPVAADEVKVKAESTGTTPSAGTFTFPKFAGGPTWDTWSTDFRRAASSPILVPIDATIRGHLKIPGDQGLMVRHVPPQSPAAAAGIRDQDILLTLGTSPLANPGDLTKALKEAGEKPLPLTLLRGGEKQTIQVQPMIEIGLGPIPSERPTYAIGVVASPVDPLLRSQLKLPDGRGLIVGHVDPKGPAAAAGVVHGDIILELNGKPVDQEGRLFNFVQDEGEKPITLRMIHEGAGNTVTVTPVPRKNAVIGGSGSVIVLDEGKGMTIRARAVPLSPVYRDVTTPIGPFIVNPVTTGQSASRPPLGPFIVNPVTTGQSASRPPRPSPEQHGNRLIVDSMKLEASSKDQKASSADAVAKRLDKMSSQIDSLSKAVDELAKAIKDKK